MTNDKLKQFFISKVKSLNQSEIKLLLAEINNPNQNSIFNKEFGVKIDEQRRKIRNNLNKILELEPNLKKIFAPFLNEKNDDTNVIDFNWSELIDFLDIVNEYGLKYDNSCDNLDVNNVLRKSLKKIGEHFDENERLLILDWLNKKESNASNQLKKYQLLIRIALSNLIDKNRLIDQMFDELFDFYLENSNVIKKIKGEEVDLHEFDNIILNRIQDEIIFKKIYDWSRDTFKTSDHDERIAMFTYVDFFVEKLWNAEFLPNWFNDVINKNDSLQQIFTPSKIKNVFTTFWNNELQKRQLKQRKIKEKYDKYHKQFTQGLCDFLIKNLNRSNLIPIAKKVLREKLQKDLINEINKISVEIMRDKFFNKNANNDFINDLEKFFTENKQIFADCSFLEKSHVDFIGKLQDEVYVQSLLSRIFSFEFRNKKMLSYCIFICSTKIIIITLLKSCVILVGK